jgi:hypothetical protein
MYPIDPSSGYAIFPYPSQSQRSSKQLLIAFWLLASGLLIYEFGFTATSDFSLNLAAGLITVCALLPSYFWCAGRAQGMPIFPLFSLTFIWTYALPLVTPNPGVEAYDIPDRIYAGYTAAVFLALGTFIWFQFVKLTPPTPPVYRALDNRRGNQFFLGCLAVSVLLNMAIAGNWFSTDFSGFSLLRNVVIALTALSAFVLSYRLGNQELSKRQSMILIVLLIGYALSSAVSLLLIGAATTSLGAIAAFVIGRKRIPIVTILILVACLSFLHAGKDNMRAEYWSEDQQTFQLQVWEYPAFYTEWAEYASKSFFKSEDNLEPEDDEQSFLERSSVIQMLLLTQTNSPEPIPFLYGNTYEILPQLILPRIFNPQKIASHEGTYRLNVHYGRQTYEEATRAVIAWGLLAEAYANFGLLGCAGLAIGLGVLYGMAARWSINAPILSIQSLFAVLMLTFALQSEWTAGVYVAAFFQYCMVLLGIAVVLMRRYPAQLLWCSP